MKKEIELRYANRLINDGPVVLVTSIKNDKPNIFTVAWNMPVSHDPPVLAIASGIKNYSTSLIKGTKEFTINVPEQSLKDKVIDCGKRTGRDIDKFKEFGLTPVKSKFVKPPIIEECIGHLECVVVKVVRLYDHFLFLGRVESVYVEEDKFDFSKNVWNLKNAKILHHLGGFSFSVSTEVV